MKLFRKLFLITTLITSILFLSCNFLYQQDKYAGFISEEQLNQYIESNTIIPNGTQMLGVGGSVVIFLTTTGASNWTVPADWNSANNSIECLGGGGSNIDYSPYTSGGGGAYSLITNLLLTSGSTINFNIGGDTWFNGTSLSSASVSAGGGKSDGNGGKSINGIGTIKYSGGNGGSYAGGGGAAGPNGNGNNGIGYGYGGSADAGYGGLGGANGNPVGSNGENGTEWDATHGSGGGGGAGYTGYAGRGGYGGNYGGGVGSGQATRNGAQGIIVITYLPAILGNFNFLFF